MLDADCRATLERLAVRRGRVLLAVSGGRDSMVLLDLMRRCAGSQEIELSVAHIQHGLRGLASEADEELVRRVAAEAGLDCHVRRIDPEGPRRGSSSRERPTLEEASRNLRRAALDEIAREAGCDWIAIGHHAGDQAETLLLRILRGTGPDGLAGMAEIGDEGRRIRPLLRVFPETLEEWATTRGLEWREDASNHDRRFARNRLRLDVVPELAETFNPRLLRTLSDLAEAGRRDLEWIEALVDEAARETLDVGRSGIRFAIDGWDVVPEALARRLVRRGFVAAGLGRDVTRAHLARVLAFLRKGRAAGRDKRLELPGGFVLRRGDDCFTIAPEAGAGGFDPLGNATLLKRD